MAWSALLGPAGEARARGRAAQQLVLALPAVLCMLAVHLPEVLGLERPWLAVGLVLGLGCAAGAGILAALSPPRTSASGPDLG